MTAPVLGLLAIFATVGASIAWAFRQEALDDRAAEASRKAPAASHGPARRLRRAAGRPVDGDCLSAEEWDLFVGALFASWRHVDEPEYERGGAS